MEKQSRVRETLLETKPFMSYKLYYRDIVIKSTWHRTKTDLEINGTE